MMTLLSRSRTALVLLFVFAIALHRGEAQEEENAIDEEGNDSEMSLAGLTWHTREQLLDVVEQLGRITGELIPIYRDDLASDYVAYWSIELNDKDYVVISTGSETGDYGLAIQGSLPSLVTLVNTTATGYGESCDRFYMFTPSGEMMCRNRSGEIVATSAEDRFYPEQLNGDAGHAHNDLESRMGDFVILWKRRALRVEEENVWADTTEDDDSFTQNYITPGDVIRLPVGNDTSAIHVEYVPESDDETEATKKATQQNLCSVLSSCSGDSGNHTAQDLNLAYSLRGVPCIDTAISVDAYNILGNQSVSFKVVITRNADTTIVRHFSLQLNVRRSKRSWTQKRAWSTTFKETSIPYPEEFPDYKSHKLTWTSAEKAYRVVKVTVNIGWINHVEMRNMSMPVSRKVCDVGSGPIAWAEVFGYLDRRSHAHSDKFQSGSQTIYACGDYGTDGKPRCVAPSGGSTFRQRGYTNAIAKIMDSECQNEDTTIGDESWTPIAKMVKVKAFFQARQKTGTPRVEKTKLVWKMPGDKVYMRDRMVGWVKAGWPVIVGTDEAGKRHYAVVTAFRRKSRKVRKCSGTKGTTTSCKAWYYRYKNYQMFTHQGDGTNGNRWQSINIHFLITAKY